LDSGGFTELDTPRQLGSRTDPAAYVAVVRRYRDEIGQLAWAAPQNWMCEPWIIAKTGLSIVEHQRRTVENYLTLRALAPDLPFVPVVQGWQINDYLTCVELYAAAGVDLAAAPVVGLGSVCRRQATDEAAEIVDALHLVCVGPRAMRLDERTGTWTLLDGPALDHTVHDTSATMLRYVLPLRDTRGGQRSKPTRCAPRRLVGAPASVASPSFCRLVRRRPGAGAIPSTRRLRLPDQGRGLEDDTPSL
jgi:hypothetical protein